MRIEIEMNEKFGKGYQVRSFGDSYQNELGRLVETEYELYPVEDSRPYDIDDAIRIAMLVLETYNYATGRKISTADSISVSVEAIIKNRQIAALIV